MPDTYVRKTEGGSGAAVSAPWPPLVCRRRFHEHSAAVKKVIELHTFPPGRGSSVLDDGCGVASSSPFGPQLAQK